MGYDHGGGCTRLCAANGDTNVTLTLGGSPTTALLNAASITVGWSGTGCVARRLWRGRIRLNLAFRCLQLASRRSQPWRGNFVRGVANLVARAQTPSSGGVDKLPAFLHGHQRLGRHQLRWPSMSERAGAPSSTAAFGSPSSVGFDASITLGARSLAAVRNISG